MSPPPDTLPPEVEASYTVIIDGILAASDLSTISSKRIREGLQAAVNYDISRQKDAIKALIMKRFDKKMEEQSKPVTNGHAEPVAAPAPEETAPPAPAPPPPTAKPAVKRKSISVDDDDDTSDVAGSPPPKKKKKQAVESDAALAARLQAEENSRARPTRGGTAKRAAPVKKKKAPKKKSASKIKSTDDSDVDSDSGEEKKVNRSSAFHKPYNLSPALSELAGEAQLSRPQTVKKVWEYIRAHDLQDPTDKRQIICDDMMRAVFKTDRIHMFTMNKILNKNLYDPEG